MEDVPHGTSVLEWARQCDESSSSPRHHSPLLSSAVSDFMAGADQTLALLGDAGGGKSTFALQLGRSLCGPDTRRFLATPVTLLGPAELPFLPLYIELKRYKASQVKGLLPRVLMGPPYSLSEEAVAAVRDQIPSDRRVRLLVVCDGYDELHVDEPVTDVVSLICGGEGARWPSSVLKVIVTSRPNRFSSRVEEARVFGHHKRLLLLPFSEKRV